MATIPSIAVTDPNTNTRQLAINADGSLNNLLVGAQSTAIAAGATLSNCH
jgi:hypothetical protein